MLQARHLNPVGGWGQHIMQLAGARDRMARHGGQWRNQHNAGRKRSFWEICAEPFKSGFAEHLLTNIASIAVLPRNNSCLIGIYIMLQISSELMDVPTDGIISTGEKWLFTRFIPSKNGKPARLIESQCLVLHLTPAPDCTVTRLAPELRELVARIVQMLLSQVDTMGTARESVPALGELPLDPAGTS